MPHHHVVMLTESVTTYFVDQVNGNDSNSGLSTTAAWKTLAKVNSATFKPGNQILLNRGNTWAETLTLPSSGKAGAPIVFGAYGSGALPLIDGGNVRSQCVSGNAQSYITLQDLATQNSTGDQWGMYGTFSNVLIQRCTVHAGAAAGITVTGTNSHISNCVFDHQGLMAIYCHQNATGLWVDHCTISYTGDHGIKVMMSNGLFEWNEIHHSKLNGYYLEGRPSQGVSANGNIFRFNWCHENGQVIIDLSNGGEIYNSGGDYNTFFYNIMGPGGPGISTVGFWLDYGSVGNQFYNNTIYHMRGGTQGRGYKLENGAEGGATQNNTMMNNIVIDCFQECLEVYDTINSGPYGLQGNVIDYNLYWRGSTPDSGLIYNGRTTSDMTLAQFQATPGNPDAHSINLDPLLNNQAANDVTLKAGSPAIGAGASLGSVYEMGRKPGGGVTSQVLAGLGWEMGAYVYTS